MKKSLIDSKVDRGNILNNPFALQEIKNQIGIKTYFFKETHYITAKEITDFYDIDIRTLRRYLAINEKELKDNGYIIIEKEDLSQFINLFVGDTDVTNKSPKLALFSFRSFLNLGMLLANNETAKAVRRLILDITIETINQKTSGNAKYANQRDENYLILQYLGEKYNQDFKNALKNHVDMGNFKYAIYGRKIYQIIFKERVDEYRKLLNLQKLEKTKDTLYAEVLATISSFESGLAEGIEREAGEKKRKLDFEEVNRMLDKLAIDPLMSPQLELARTKMASLDNVFRDVEHTGLTDYISIVGERDYQKFLGKESMSLKKRIMQQQEIFKRLKDK